MTSGAPPPQSPQLCPKTKLPIMVFFELLCRRHTLRILWELQEGPLNFRDLQKASGNISPTSLNKRVDELSEALILAHIAGEGYTLTPLGLDLVHLFHPLRGWLERWTKAVTAAGKDIHNL